MEITQEQADNLAGQITAISFVIAGMDDEALAACIEVQKKDIATYEAIGILDGNPRYFQKLADKKARNARAEALLAFIRVSKETSKDILREEA